MSPLSTLSLSTAFSASQADCVADRSFGGCSLRYNGVPRTESEICEPHIGVGFELRAHDCVKHQYPAEDNQESHPELVDEGVEPVVRVCDQIFGTRPQFAAKTTTPPRRVFSPVRKDIFVTLWCCQKCLVSRVNQNMRNDRA